MENSISRAFNPSPAQRWSVVAVLWAAIVMSFIDKTILSLLLPGIQIDFQLTDSQIGFLAGAPFGIFYMIGGLVNGTLADRYSRTTIVVLMVLVWSFATVLCGVATTFLALLLLRAVLGFSEGGVNPTSAAIIGDTFPDEQRAAPTGVLFSAVGFGVMITFLVGGPLIAWLQDIAPIDLLGYARASYWQAAFILVGLPGFFLAGLMAYIFAIPGLRLGQNSKDRIDYTRWSAVYAHMMDYRKIYLGVLVGMPIAVIGPYSLLPWLAVYLQRVHEWSVGTTGVVYGLTAGPAMLLGGLLIGPTVRMMKRRGIPDASYRLCLVSAIWLVLFSTIGVAVPSDYLAIGCIAIGFTAFMVPPAMMYVVISEVAPRRMRARIGGLSLVTAGLTLNGLGPFAVGFFNDTVFSPNLVHLSIILVSVPSFILGGSIMIRGLASFRRATLTPSKEPA